uniref:Uncharacterized protein n=1 Tax=Arundo donax TaxID=35708 RepID=A0A0A9HB80_ARUDO
MASRLAVVGSWNVLWKRSEFPAPPAARWPRTVRRPAVSTCTRRSSFLNSSIYTYICIVQPRTRT